jgi:RNA polymerase sigma factor (sigma-70 family)
VDEKQIIELFLRTRSEEIFCELFAVVYPRVHRYFRLRGMDSMMAEDLAQNVLLIVFQRSGELREANLFLGWMFAIARNELLRFWRQSRARIETVEFDAVEMDANPHFHLEPTILRDARFYEWLRSLDPADRDLVRRVKLYLLKSLGRQQRQWR